MSVSSNSLKYTAGSKDLCTYVKCNKPGELRKCSKCQLAWYCSRDCQKADWPEHRKTCKDHFANNDSLDPLLRWADKWREALEAWGAFALNALNRGDAVMQTFLVDNSFLIEIVKNRDSKESSNVRRRYLLKSTGFYPDTTIRNMLANAAGPPDYPRSICAQFDGVKARAKPTALRMTIVCRGGPYVKDDNTVVDDQDIYMMFLQVISQIGSLDVRGKITDVLTRDLGPNKQVAAKLAAGYEKVLAKCLKEGKGELDGYKKFYDSVREKFPPNPPGGPELLGAFATPISADMAASLRNNSTPIPPEVLAGLQRMMSGR
ncbi:hypothetical protein EV715DRAFT_201727 [Schizophyllum commune]